MVSSRKCPHARKHSSILQTKKFDVDEKRKGLSNHIKTRTKISVGREISLSFVPDLLRLELRGHEHVVDDVGAVDGVYRLLPTRLG